MHIRNYTQMNLYDLCISSVKSVFSFYFCDIIYLSVFKCLKLWRNQPHLIIVEFYVGFLNSWNWLKFLRDTYALLLTTLSLSLSLCKVCVCTQPSTSYNGFYTPDNSCSLHLGDIRFPTFESTSVLRIGGCVIMGPSLGTFDFFFWYSFIISNWTFVMPFFLLN